MSRSQTTPDESFVTSEPSDEQQPKRGKKKSGIKVSIVDGALDTSNLSEDDQVELYSALASDENLTSTISEMHTMASTAGQVVQPSHVVGLLHLFEILERLTIPPIVRKKTGIEIPRDIAVRSFKFADEDLEKISTPGAVAIDSILPQWAKEWLLKTGPWGEMFSALGVAIAKQTEAAVMLTIASKKQEEQVQ